MKPRGLDILRLGYSIPRHYHTAYYSILCDFDEICGINCLAAGYQKNARWGVVVFTIPK